MNIIVGLGNPGEKYKSTRHNVGFMIVDNVVEKLGLSWEMNKKFNSFICKDGDTIYVKPQMFMNNSGQAVQAVMSYYKLLPKKLGFINKKDCDLSEILTVIHDDIDIEFSKTKNSDNSRSGGHNGVQSVINYLKTKQFKRIRIGVKTEMLSKMPADKFVLQRFSEEELVRVREVINGIVL